MSPEQIKAVFFGDRGYCSYSNMVHVIEYDTTVHVTLTRSNASKISLIDSQRRFIDKKVSFDYIDYGSLDTYQVSFRVVRFSIDSGDFECLVTNLPIDEFPFGGDQKAVFSQMGH